MKYLFINSVLGYGSTGVIVANRARDFMANGDECIVAYGRGEKNADDIKKWKIGTKWDVALHVGLSRVFDMHGRGSVISTKLFLHRVDKYNPDVVWLDNIHGYYLNLKLLFQWIKKHPEKKYYWTLHDCWAFTGHCAYFTMAQCGKWKIECKKCPQKGTYPKSLLGDNSKYNYRVKRKLFTGISNMELVVPSQWLKELVRQSFLREYPVEVVNNQINKNIFKPTISDFRIKHKINNKFVILGVASPWDKRKGLKDFITLSKILDARFQIVLVGVTEKEKKQIPENVICIERTTDQEELAKIYTAADVYLNLTYEDNYPTTNLESQACGTTCITYRTGGSIESVPDQNVIECGNIEQLIHKIEELYEDRI